MPDNEVEIDVSLNDSQVASGTARIKSKLAGIEDADKSLSWKGIASGSSAAFNLGKMLAGAGTAMTMGITVPLSMIGKTSIQMAADFQTTMAQVQVATGEGSDGMAQLEAYAKQMGAETIYSASECGDAMLELAKGGLTSADIQGGALANTLTLATAGGLQLSDAANTIVQAMGAFGLSADESYRATDALAGAANASSADVSDLAQGLAQCSAVANNAGWSIEDTAAVMGELADAGIQGSDAGTSLKTMLMSIEAPSSAAAKCMEQYGINVRDANGRILDATSLSQEFQDKLGGLDDAQQQAALSTIFGSDAMRAGTVLMNNGADGLKKYTDATNSAQSAQDMANASMSGTNGAMEQLSGSVDNVKMAIGDALAPTLVQVAGFLQNLADGFSNLDPGMQQVIVVIGLIVAALGPILTVAGGIIAMLPALQAGFEVLTTSLTIGGAAASGMGGALGVLLGPIGLVIAAVVAVVAALAYLWNTNEGFRDAAMSAIDQLVSAAQPAIDLIIACFMVLASTVGPVLDGLAQMVGAVFVGAIQAAAGIISGCVSVIIGTFYLLKGQIEIILGLIVGIFTGDWSLLQQGAEDCFSGILSIGTGLLNALSGVCQGLLTSIVGIFAGAWNGMTGAASAAFSTLASIVGDRLGDAQSTVSDGLNAISGFFSSLHLEFPHINLPHFTVSGEFNLDPANFSVPSLGIDWYAKGGVFKSASVIGIGEGKDDEAALPLNKKTYGEIADGISSEGRYASSDRIEKLLEAILDAIPTDWKMECDKREIARLVAEVS